MYIPGVHTYPVCKPTLCVHCFLSERPVCTPTLCIYPPCVYIATHPVCISFPVEVRTGGWSPTPARPRMPVIAECTQE